MAAQSPVACASLQVNVQALTNQINDLQDELKDGPAQAKPKIIARINALRPKLQKAEQDLKACIANNTYPPFAPPPQPTKPDTSSDTTPVIKTKVISLSFLQKKFDEIFNKRTDPPIFKLRLHHHDHISNGSVDNDPPASDYTFYFIDAFALLGYQSPRFYQGYKNISYSDLGQLDYEYYFNDINSNFFNVNIDTTQPAPLEVKITFETDGPTEMPSTGHLYPDMKFKEFYISLKFTLGFDQQNHKVDLLSWITDLDDLKVTPKIVDLAPWVNLSGMFLGKQVSQDFLLSTYQDKSYKYFFAEQIVHVHIVTTDAIDPGGAAQKSMRQKIFDKLIHTDASGNYDNRDAINAEVNRWILGEDGKFPVTYFKNDGQQITISYSVPKNMLNPFPFIPSNWPAANSPNSNPNMDFSPGALANIDHIVVLTKENRSFDHILGYLSLPANKGGMGRKEVDGLKGGETNPYDGVNYPSFPFEPGQTLFAPNANQNAGPSFHQVDGGKMDGFVRSYAEEASNPADGENTGNGSTVMGYHNGANVPIYDALARDFAICHRWFAAHPGPTFPNRYYEVTGRLNLNSGLSDSTQKGFWEIDNTSTLTSVLTKTIFDYLNDYSHIANVSWNYFEYFYCFLRFFADYTFDNVNVVDAEDPLNGFFVKARTGTLPSVSFIDPHFIDFPPHANCDEPPSDIKDGQALVQTIVEAVIASPKWNKTLLIIIYDEHGGFYDHVPPPPLKPFPDDPTNYNLPVSTYGLRIPVFFISPWVGAGQVFGHDASNGSDALFFDNNSILKTIAKRFMSDYPPYMGPHYAMAKDLSVVIGNTLRQPQFLPFIRYNFMYNASQKMLDVQNANTAPGTMLWQWDKNGTIAQDFSFEDAGSGFVYIRTHTGNLYVTVHVPPLVANVGEEAPVASQNHQIKQDYKYKEAIVVNTVNANNPAYQKWKLSPAGITVLNRDLFVISNAFFPNKVLKALDNQTGGAVVLGDPDPGSQPFMSKYTWTVTSPLISHQIVVA
jgi:phospholipase C